VGSSTAAVGAIGGVPPMGLIADGAGAGWGEGMALVLWRGCQLSRPPGQLRPCGRQAGASEAPGEGGDTGGLAEGSWRRTGGSWRRQP